MAATNLEEIEDRIATPRKLLHMLCRGPRIQLFDSSLRKFHWPLSSHMGYEISYPREMTWT